MKKFIFLLNLFLIFFTFLETGKLAYAQLQCCDPSAPNCPPGQTCSLPAPLSICSTLKACQAPPPGAPTATPALSCGSLCSGIGDSRCPSGCPCNYTTGGYYCNPSAPTFAPPASPYPTIDIHGPCPTDKITTALGCVPVGSSHNFSDFVGWLLKRVIGIAGGIAFLLMVFGGFKILTSAGDPKGIQAGSEMISSALIGLLFIIFSVFLLELIGVKILGIPGL